MKLVQEFSLNFFLINGRLSMPNKNEWFLKNGMKRKNDK
jgi:hypothetical protein